MEPDNLRPPIPHPELERRSGLDRRLNVSGVVLRDRVLNNIAESLRVIANSLDEISKKLTKL